MGEEAVRKLLAKDWSALKEINLGGNKIGDGGLQVLLHRVSEKLQKLSLGSASVTQTTMKPAQLV